MQKTSRRIALVVVATATLVAGCSHGGGSAGTQHSNPDDGTSSSLATSTINAQARESLEQGGKLRFAVSGLPRSWNVMSTQGNSADTGKIFDFLQDSNWIYADDGTFTPNTDYVEDYSVQDATADQGQIVTLTLNPKATWNSGRPISWEDYQADWKACNGENADFLCASTDGWDQITSIEQGSDQFQVVVTFKEAYPDWSSILETVLPKEGVSEAATFNEGWNEYNNEWTAGPYIVDSVDEAQQVVSLVKNPQWWGNPPFLDTVTFRALDSTASANAFANSEIDVLSSITTGDQYMQASARTDAEIRTSSGLTWRHFTFNSESGALQDKAVRQAIAKGINRQAIATSDLAGIPGIDASDLVLGNHLFMQSENGYQDNSGEFAYDPDKAGSELDGLGWALNQDTGYREKDGTTLEFTYTVNSGTSISQNEGELLQTQMQKIGVKADLANIGSDSFGDTTEGGQFGVTSFAWVGNDYPMANIGQVYGCGNSLAQNGGANYARYCDPDLESLISKVDVETDNATRIELANQADQMIWDDVMVLPLYALADMRAVPKDLANYGALGLANFKAEDVGYTS